MPPKEEKILADKMVQRQSLIAMLKAVGKFIAEFDPVRDGCQVQVRIDSLDKVNVAFAEVQDTIERLDSDDLEAHLADRVDFEHQYCTAKGFLLSNLPTEVNHAQLNASFAALPANFHLRLPQIDLPRFNGDFSRWLSFRDTFSSMVHSNADIPTVAKLQYLLQSLEGEAKKPFESVDIEADNYACTWDALLKRYDNRRFLKRKLFRALYDLSAVKQESANRIHSLIDDFQRHVKALKKLNEPVEHWDTPLVNILSYKLDQSTLRAWEEKTSTQDDVKYEELVEFLYQRVRVLNSVGYEHHQQPSPSAKLAGNIPKSSKFKFAANTAVSSNSSSPCILSCSDNHALRNCPIFLGKDIRLRRELVTQKRLCWNCLCSGHQVKKCTSKFSCRTCHERHHSLLHDPALSKSSSSSTVSSSVPVQEPSPSTSVVTRSSAPPKVSMAVQTACNTVLLETVVLNVVDDHGHEYQARALLDSASMSNFISKPLANLLFNQRSKVDISIAGIGLSTQIVKSAITATIQSRTQEFSTKLQFLILKNPSAQLPTIPLNISSWKLPKVALADPQFHIPGRIDLVIGSEAFWELHSGRKIPLGDGLPWLAETPFGWAVAGTASNQHNCIPRICNLSTKDDPLEVTLQKFWEIEDISDGPALSVEEDRCEKHYVATTTRDPSGRYIVSLPRTDNPDIVLGSSRDIADRRLLSVERRLERDPATKNAYHCFMDEYLQLGHMKKLNDPVDDDQPHCYIPHHAVFKESSTTTKIRVVFDASCKTSSGYSLNDTLLVGPVVQEDLLSIVLRFRIHCVAVVADVEKMYRQMLHSPEDRKFLRIRFRTNPSDPISTYELQTVTYGTASAPYLATRTLQQIARDNGHKFPAAVNPVLFDFYVDDLLSGASDLESAIQVRQQVTSMLKTAGFPIKKWASNVPEALQDVPPEELAVQPLHDLQEEQVVSTLGLVWEPRIDALRFKVHLPPPSAVLSKRKVMSYIAQIFDPLGLVGPTIVVAKLFMQRLWALKQNGEACEWDTALPTRLQKEWKEFHNTLHLLSEVRVPRFVSLPNAVNLQLHFFADASQGAYGACCYVRAETSGGVSVQLLTAKSKVAPLSSRHSIARLELCAARLSTQLFEKVTFALKISPPAYFWTDSNTVLHWLQSPPSRWKAFVANRVSQIQHSTDVSHWKHVSGLDNPADDISRGLSPVDMLQCKRWWNGPNWLSLDPDHWPHLIPTDEEAETTAEERNIPHVAMSVVQNEFHDNLFARYSSYSKLRRVTAFCLRYLQALRERTVLRRTDPDSYHQLSIRNATVAAVSTEELQHAELHLCRLAQQQSFPGEISHLSSGEAVAKSSAMKWLKPYIDEVRIIRVDGRLRNATLCDYVKHPIVLAAKHPLSTLLASFFHLKLLHAGPQLLLATLRQKFWILGGRNLSKSVFHHCHTCFRSKPTLVQQSTADLPASRVSPTRPFSVCGVDYCGPFLLKATVRNRAPTKAYVAIFVCFATRAVHIELVSDLTTAAFLAALRRVFARRGKIVELHSDNATTFKGASHALNRIYRMLKVENSDRDRIFNWCAENEIRWKFIPPRAPHFGGLWEAAVKSAKKHLLKTVGNTNIAYEHMLTLLAQVEMCLNSRPLTPIPSEPSDLEVLTPGHFLVGANLQAVPDAADLRGIPDNRLEAYDLVQKQLQNIWARWYPEYLQQLQSRATKGCNPPVSVEVDRIVVVKEDNVPPASWPLGRIMKLHPGKDGVVRVVTLRTAAGKDIVRAITRIALLPSPNPSI